MHLLASDENPKTLGYISTGDSSVVDVTSAPRPLPNVDFRESNTSKSEIIYLNALPNPNYKVRKPIEVTITYVIDDGIEFIASAAQTEIVTSGDTVSGAVEWLVHSMIDTYEYFLVHERQLGPLPKRQLKALRGYIAKKQAKAA